MGLERYVVDAVVLEGRSPRELARLHGISKSWIYQLVTRFRAGGYDALTAAPPPPPRLLPPGRSRAPGGDHRPPPRTRRRRLRRRPRQHPPPPPPALSPGSRPRYHLAHPLPPRPGHPSAPEAPPLLLRPLRGLPPQRDVAGRHHPLAPRRRPGRRDPQPPRRPLPPPGRLRHLPHLQGPGRRPELLRRRRTPRLPRRPAHRQRRSLQRRLTPWQGAPRIRAGTPRHPRQDLHSLSPPDLRQG